MGLESHETAFVVVRVDHFPGVGEPLPAERELDGPAIRFGDFDVTVKEVVMTQEEAQREVARLNGLSTNKRCRYYWQSTHLFSEGSHGSRAV